MKTSFLIFLTKGVTITGKILGRKASVFPGKLAYDADPKILTKVNYPKYVIGVTGSSGKGSTIELIEHGLKKAGYSVACNKSGSNGIYAITTLILNNVTIFKKNPKKDVFLIELDERHIKLAFLKPTLTHLVVTNITRDQPVRNKTPEFIYDNIFSAVKSKTHLIINADDPMVNKITTTYQDKITTYGINKTKYDYLKPKINAVDNAYCPLCHTKLIYDYYHYGHLGNYKCPNKDFKRGNVDYEGTDVNLENKTMKINNHLVKINKDILYAAYATLASYTTLKTIGIDDKIINETYNTDPIKAKRGNVYKIFNRDLIMLESKNENALSYYQSLEYITRTKGKKTIILGFDNVSRRYKYNDLSWLYDVEFEKLNDSNIDKIICIGRFKYDVATRLSYANIDEKKIVLLKDINNLLKVVKKTKGKIFTMVCFDMTERIKNLVGDLK
ncbi:MAG TPA: MurT ligase domain-containing protein [Bacilli bacterium]|nr:MurT ligase domain-containing protein [Bacilli bacterium]